MYVGGCYLRLVKLWNVGLFATLLRRQGRVGKRRETCRRSCGNAIFFSQQLRVTQGSSTYSASSPAFVWSPTRLSHRSSEMRSPTFDILLRLSRKHTRGPASRNGRRSGAVLEKTNLRRERMPRQLPPRTHARTKKARSLLLCFLPLQKQVPIFEPSHSIAPQVILRFLVGALYGGQQQSPHFLVWAGAGWI